MPLALPVIAHGNPWPLHQEGRKGIMILAPIFRKHREADAEQDATDDSRALVGYHPVFVFDESQTARRRYCFDWNRQRRSGFKPMLRITETDVAVDGAKLRLDGQTGGALGVRIEAAVRANSGEE